MASALSNITSKPEDVALTFFLYSGNLLKMPFSIFKVISLGARFLQPCPSFSVLTSEPNLYGETAFEKMDVRPMSIWKPSVSVKANSG